MSRIVGIFLFIVVLLAGGYFIGLIAILPNIAGGYTGNAIPFFGFHWVGPLIFSLALMLYIIGARIAPRPEMEQKIVRAVLVFCPLFLVYAFCLIKGFPFVNRLVGWTGWREILSERNPMFVTCSVFAVTALIFAFRFQLRFPTLKWLAILNYATVVTFLIAIALVHRYSNPPPPFYGYMQ